MTQTEQWTIGRLLEWTQDYLGQHGSQSACLDAEILLATARGCQRIDLYAAFEEEHKGSLEPGKLADITIFDTDLLKCEEAAIREARVLWTIVGGEVLYTAE